MTDIVERLLSRSSDDAGIGWTPNTVTHVPAGLLHGAADEITALRAEVERLKAENIQMQAALGYGILAEDERHILPSNPFKCGTCDASKHLCAENERLRSALRGSYEVYAGSDGFIPATAAEGYQQQIIKQMVDCISAALEGK